MLLYIFCQDQPRDSKGQDGSVLENDLEQEKKVIQKEGGSKFKLNSHRTGMKCGESELHALNFFDGGEFFGTNTAKNVKSSSTGQPNNTLTCHKYNEDERCGMTHLRFLRCNRGTATLMSRIRRCQVNVFSFRISKGSCHYPNPVRKHDQIGRKIISQDTDRKDEHSRSSGISSSNLRLHER